MVGKGTLRESVAMSMTVVGRDLPRSLFRGGMAVRHSRVCRPSGILDIVYETCLAG